MEQDNLEFLQRNLFYKGFGKELYPQLEEQMKSGVKEFTLVKNVTFNEKEYNYKIDFKHSNKNEMDRYFMNGYMATPVAEPDKAKYFEISLKDGLPAKVAANELEGKAIFRQGKDEAGIGYENWHVMDFTKKGDDGKYVENVYYKTHGFDPTDALMSLPHTKGEGAELPEWWLRSLQRGDKIEIELAIGEQPEKYQLLANPAERSIEVYDKKGKMVLSEQGLSKEYKEKQEKQQAPAQNTEQAKAPKANAPANKQEAEKSTKRVPPRPVQATHDTSQAKGRRR